MVEIHSVTSKLLGHRPLEAQNLIYFFFPLSPSLSFPPFLSPSLPSFSFLLPPSPSLSSSLGHLESKISFKGRNMRGDGRPVL